MKAKGYQMEGEDQQEMTSISIVPLEDGDECAHQALLDLQLKMATSSINHEYARMEFDDIDCFQRREELLEYMQDCREEYFRARAELEEYDPYALAEFEADLLRQKQSTLTQYHA